MELHAGAWITETLELSKDCALLRTGEERTILVWPAATTSWEPVVRVISYDTDNGSAELADGDAVTFSGGGSTKTEDGEDASAWGSSIDWLSVPSPPCVTATRWFVGFAAEDS